MRGTSPYASHSAPLPYTPNAVHRCPPSLSERASPCALCAHLPSTALLIIDLHCLCYLRCRYDTLAITNGLCGSLGEARVKQASAVLEEALAPLRARPHWGKLFSYSPEQLEELYGERLLRFRRVVRRVDEEGKFRNAWLDRYVMGE